MRPQRLGPIASVLLRMAVFSAAVLSPLSANAADTDSDRADDTKLSGGRSTPAPAQLQGVVVVGSRLPEAAGQSAQDIHVYDRERIEQSGQSTVSDFLATLPEVSLISPENTTLATQVRLRGAIFGSALILINGRRTQGVTGGAATVGFFDLNTIPISLVERIEVLPTGSSAIYGGDALAGVVNIVLRSNFTGAEAGVGYKSAKNTHEWLTWAGGGWKAGDFSLTIMANYGDRSPLHAKDRDITASPDLRRFGGPNLGNQFFGVPANVSSVSGNLPGLNSSFAAVPRGSSGIGLTPSDFAATAGTQNTGSFTSYSTPVAESHHRGVFVGATYSFGSALEVFAELLATKYKLDFVNFPPFLQLANVPASNPFNPFGTNVRVSGVVQGAESLAPSSFEEEFVRPLVGARGRIGTWEWELSALNSRDRGSSVTAGLANTAALNVALASSNPQTALNPFVDGPMANPTVLASIYSNATISNFKADATIVDAFARGLLLDLPAGPMTAVVGAEYEKSNLERTPEGIDANRNVRAAFTELRVPVFASTDERGEKREVLALQGAARYDDYSDFGSKTTWQAAFELRPVERLLLRGTHATAFKPPTLYNIAAPVSSNPGTVSDPSRNGETVVVQSLTGGNAALRPTTGTSSTLGFVWSPAQVRDLNVSMTRWWMRIEDAINFPVNPQFIVDNEALFPGRVIRAPAAPGTVGQIVAVDRTYLNYGTMHQAGIDGSIDWRLRTALGDFTPAVAATYMTKFEGASVAGAPSVDRLSRANNDQVFAPRWKGIASIGWIPAPAFNVWLDGRYIGSYTDYTPPRKIGNIWYLDASVDVNVEQALRMSNGSLGGMRLLLSGTNLTDKLPDWSTFFRGYDVLNYDIVGRTLFVRLKLQL
jgi:iron complex outermembrane recepter protein